MWTKRDTLIFSAGAIAFHGFSHLTIHFTNLLPLQFYGITLTYSFNVYVIIASVIITAALLWWASRVK